MIVLIFTVKSFHVFLACKTFKYFTKKKWNDLTVKIKTIVLNIKWIKNNIEQLHTKHTFEMTENLTVLLLRKNTAEFISSKLCREVSL